MMTSHVSNPLAFAMEEFNVAINSHGDFTYVRFGRELEKLRVRLQGGNHARLVRRLTDLDGEITSLFECYSTGALILVREQHVCDAESGLRLGRRVDFGHVTREPSGDDLTSGV